MFKSLVGSASIVLLMYCYVLCDWTKQLRLLDLASGVDGEGVVAKVFQLNCATKLPVWTTHSDHMRLDLLDRFALEIFHDGKWFLSEDCMRCSNNDSLCSR